MLALKYIHISLAALSITLFVVRFVSREAGAAFIQARFFKIAPHLIDTCLLISGITLVVMVGYSLWPVNWLSIKLVLVVAYIVSGFVAMKAVDRGRRWGALVVAMVFVGGVVYLAIGKGI